MAARPRGGFLSRMLLDFRKLRATVYMYEPAQKSPRCVYYGADPLFRVAAK